MVNRDGPGEKRNSGPQLLFLTDQTMINTPLCPPPLSISPKHSLYSSLASRHVVLPSLAHAQYGLQTVSRITHRVFVGSLTYYSARCSQEESWRKPNISRKNTIPPPGEQQKHLQDCVKEQGLPGPDGAGAKQPITGPYPALQMALAGFKG